MQRTISNYFDWQFYITHYKDLQLAGISTPEQASEHYRIHGKREGRLINRPQYIINKKTKADVDKAFDNYICTFY